MAEHNNAFKSHTCIINLPAMIYLNPQSIQDSLASLLKSLWLTLKIHVKHCYGFDKNFSRGWVVNKGTFPYNAKITCISPVDKHADDKHCVTNFWFASVLNTFWKIYERFSMECLISKMGTSFFIIHFHVQKIL